MSGEGCGRWGGRGGGVGGGIVQKQCLRSQGTFKSLINIAIISFPRE